MPEPGNSAPAAPKRISLILLVALYFTPCIFVGCVWCCSLYAPQVLEFKASEQSHAIGVAFRGEWCLRVFSGMRGRPVQPFPRDSVIATPGAFRFGDRGTVTRSELLGGISFESGTGPSFYGSAGPAPWSFWGAAGPEWILVVLSGFIPCCWTVRLLVRHRRLLAGIHRGACVHCGYDKRMTPLQCPECGRTSAPCCNRRLW